MASNANSRAGCAECLCIALELHQLDLLVRVLSAPCAIRFTDTFWSPIPPLERLRTLAPFRNRLYPDWAYSGARAWVPVYPHLVDPTAPDDWLRSNCPLLGTSLCGHHRIDPDIRRPIPGCVAPDETPMTVYRITSNKNAHYYMLNQKFFGTIK